MRDPLPRKTTKGSLTIMQDMRWDAIAFSAGHAQRSPPPLPSHQSLTTLPTNANMRMQMSQAHIPFLAGLASGLAAASAATF